jgi:hypothetical protein
MNKANIVLAIYNVCTSFKLPTRWSKAKFKVTILVLALRSCHKEHSSEILRIEKNITNVKVFKNCQVYGPNVHS